MRFSPAWIPVLFALTVGAADEQLIVADSDARPPGRLQPGSHRDSGAGW
jgi:hypothetical protein